MGILTNRVHPSCSLVSIIAAQVLEPRQHLDGETPKMKVIDLEKL